MIVPRSPRDSRAGRPSGVTHHSPIQRMALAAQLRCDIAIPHSQGFGPMCAFSRLAARDVMRDCGHNLKRMLSDAMILPASACTFNQGDIRPVDIIGPDSAISRSALRPMATAPAKASSTGPSLTRK
jgi:hypothetical protein